MGYRLVEVDLVQPVAPITLSAEQTGVGLVARFRERVVGFGLLPAPAGSTLDADRIEAFLAERFSLSAYQATAEDEAEARWPATPPPPPPSLTVAICTKDRPQRLARLLSSLQAVRHSSGFSRIEILVVDNAPSDDQTREAVLAADDIRYHCEPKPGLNFGRNAALHGATGDLLAFLDDDVVVDPYWLRGLFKAWAGCPQAGGFTGLVLPFRLDTEAQVHFERRGGFGRGSLRTDFRNERLGNLLHPVGSGLLGAGCNMCFDRALVLSLGGFDEALDTGAPLPGGGDLDIFYRVMRAGRVMVYEPSYAVYHEHRETLAQLKHQYWTWGLGFMAYLEKCRRTDPAMRARQDGIVWWWLADKLGELARASLRRRPRDLEFAWAELKGGLQGMAGEYDRSVRRSQRIRERFA